MITEEQLSIINLIENGKNLFITGMAGTGKTFIINAFRNKWKHKKQIAVTSTTGVSALLINGSTLHSFLGIGLGTLSTEALYKKIIDKNFYYSRWKKLEILIIDEVSMLVPELFDKLEHLARMLRQTTKPFGGIQLILTGDMLQLPPIKSNIFCFEAKTWDKCIDHTIYLTHNLRQNEKEFQECLSEIRLGFISPENEKILKSRENIILTNDLGIIPTKIRSLNTEVDDINISEMSKLDEDVYEYDLQTTNYGVAEFVIQKIIKNSNLVETLQLCKGAQVMLLANLDISAGLVNGSRGIITDFVEDIPIVKFLNGTEIIIDYHDVEIEEDNKLICTLTQIPLRVAYAVSTHKIQGNTLDYCEIDFKNFFEYGQAYVALSRVRKLENLIIKNFDTSKIKANPKALSYYISLPKYV